MPIKCLSQGLAHRSQSLTLSLFLFPATSWFQKVLLYPHPALEGLMKLLTAGSSGEPSGQGKQGDLGSSCS